MARFCGSGARASSRRFARIHKSHNATRAIGICAVWREIENGAGGSRHDMAIVDENAAKPHGEKGANPVVGSGNLFLVRIVDKHPKAVFAAPYIALLDGIEDIADEHVLFRVIGVPTRRKLPYS